MNDRALSVTDEIRLIAETMKYEINARYFPGGGPTTVQESTSMITPLIDGEEYFNAVRMEIGYTQTGDAVYMLGWRFDANFRFSKDPKDVSELGQVLAIKAASGVDVRMIMPTKWQLLYLLESKTDAELRKEVNDNDFNNQLDRYGPKGNVKHAGLLRNLLVNRASSPLRARVLLDHSGEIGGIHHQKLVFVIRGGNAVGFLAGLDFLGDRLDNSRHDEPLPRQNATDPNDRPKYYWHDAGVRIEGPVVQDLYFFFKLRWANCLTLPERKFKLADGLDIPSLNPSIEMTSLRDPLRFSTSAPLLTGVYVAANFPENDVPGTSPIFHEPSNVFSKPPIHTTGNLYQKAVAASKKYVYIEDQYFNAGSLNEVLRAAAQRGVKIIALLGGVDDDAGGKPVEPKLADPTTIALLNSMGPFRSNVSILQLKSTIVHSKLVIIDDEFLAIGSTNFSDRSLLEAQDVTKLGQLLKVIGQAWGTDSELTIAATDPGQNSPSLALLLRLRLWSEHLRVNQWDATVRKELSDLSVALSIFKGSWGRAVSFNHENSRLVPVQTD